MKSKICLDVLGEPPLSKAVLPALRVCQDYYTLNGQFVIPWGLMKISISCYCTCILYCTKQLYRFQRLTC